MTWTDHGTQSTQFSGEDWPPELQSLLEEEAFHYAMTMLQVEGAEFSMWPSRTETAKNPKTSSAHHYAEAFEIVEIVVC